MAILWPIYIEGLEKRLVVEFWLNFNSNFGGFQSSIQDIDKQVVLNLLEHVLLERFY